jgi:DNA repair ATPase RecN
MEIKTQSLKELYEKDFYLWVQENLKLLKNREYDLADWENLLEEIEDMGQRYLDSAISFIAVILEHLYKLENFRDREDMGHSWKKSINNARNELDVIFERHPSIRKKSAEELPTAWRIAVKRLVRWFKEDENYDLAKNFPQECPYTFEQVMEYEPWVEKK